jgi:hypothetical protein
MAPSLRASQRTPPAGKASLTAPPRKSMALPVLVLYLFLSE